MLSTTFSISTGDKNLFVKVLILLPAFASFFQRSMNGVFFVITFVRRKTQELISNFVVKYSSTSVLNFPYKVVGQVLSLFL